MRLTRTTTDIGKIILCGVLLICLCVSRAAQSTAVSNTEPETKITFTFDDAYESTYTKAAPVLEKYGFTGVSYVDGGNVGKEGRMAWDQIKHLKDRFGWEIGAHSYSHPLMTEIPASRQEQEVAKSKQILLDNGIEATSFATPFGDYNNKVIAMIARHFESHRGFWDTGSNLWPYNEYLLSVQQVQAGTSVDQVKQYVDNAIVEKKWLILVFHDIKEQPSNDPKDYQYSVNDLATIAEYVQRASVDVTQITSGFTESNVNLLPNPTFDEGLGAGWSTDTPEQVQIDTEDNGNFPSPKNSVLLTASSSSTHLFSPKISVESYNTYMVKSFLHVTNIVSGQVGYYIDEYDSTGKWISGQWKKSEHNAFVENINFAYTPSSPAVKKARLQIFVTPGSGVKAYVDNIQWFPFK